MASRKERRIGYDLLWGGLLTATCLVPVALADGERFSWWRSVRSAHATGDVGLLAWLLAGSAAGFAALVLGLKAPRSRWRHFCNFALGAGTVFLAVRLGHSPIVGPLARLGSGGGLIPVAAIAVYAGAGMRIARPKQPGGLAVGGLGALLLFLALFVPMGGESAIQREWPALAALEWRAVMPLLLVVGAALLGAINLVHHRAESLVARVVRLLLLGALVTFLAGGHVAEAEAGSSWSATLLPVAWTTVRSLGPLFLCLDGAVAFIAITLTRSND